MNRAEWNAYAESTPITSAQRGAIMRECERLGLTDRGERLTVLAGLLGVDELDTTADLTMGQAGQLVGALQRARDRGELPDVTRVDDGQGDDGLSDHCGCCAHSRSSGCGGSSCPCRVPADDGEPRDGMSVAEVLARILLMAYAAWHGNGDGTGPANVGIKVDQPRERGDFTG